MDWDALFGTRRRVDLPTYAFQRQRYWLDFLAGMESADVASAGLSAPDHPLLGAVVDHPGTDEVVFTDLWSLRTHGWLADHAVFGAVVVPATAYLDLALSVGDHVGCGARRGTHLGGSPDPPRLGRRAGTGRRRCGGRDGTPLPGRVLAPRRRRPGGGRLDPSRDGEPGTEHTADGHVGKRHALARRVATGRGPAARHRRSLRLLRGRGFRLRSDVPRAARGLAAR